MPTQQPSGASGQKQLIVFVHGFGSTPHCWSPLLRLLKADPQVSQRFDFACYSYATSWFNFSLLRRIPDLQEISEGLGAFLEGSRFEPYADITLVGHSQGGLVIQKYIADKLHSDKGYDLARVRQVILIATPNLGSTIMAPARNILFRVFDNPQERTLRVLNKSIREMLQSVLTRVVHAENRSEKSWPIPITCFWGDIDAIVPEASARGHYPESMPLPGDHFTVLKPRDHDDERYRRIVDALLEPVGHTNFFEVEQYDSEIRIEPKPEGYCEEVRYGNHPEKKRNVTTDNLAHASRTVAFSKQNRCKKHFKIRYRTRDDGFVRAILSHRNEAPSETQGRYDDYGNEVSFQFKPQPGEVYKAEFEVYKGFEKGNHDIHFHLGSQAHYQRYRLKLDLTAYLAAGHEITAPQMYFFPRDPDEHSSVCKQHVLENPCPYLHSDQPGIWEWELNDIHQGVIDARWDIVKAIKSRELATNSLV